MEQGQPFDPALFLSIFPFFFVGLWLAVTALIGYFSGWYRLERAFPDRREDAVLTLRFQSAAFGAGLLPANFGNCLRFDVCPNGLRVGVMRLLGPFSRPFFVPWAQVATSRRKVLFGQMVQFDFGSPPVGTMLVRLRTAERLAGSGFLRLPA